MGSLRYRLAVYPARPGSEAIRDSELPADSWRDSLQVRIPGFDGSAVLDLSEAWAAFHAGGGARHESEATSRETIVKFGDTRQITERHRVVIETVSDEPAGA